MKSGFTLTLAALVASAPVWADPPPHAPAWGHYKNHGAPHRPRDARPFAGRSGALYVRDYGVYAGRCDRDAIGTVIGGVTGAVIGSQVADREDRAVGMVVGSVIGAVVGHAIGDSIDARDRACMGQTLELGRPGVPVAWRHDGHAYRFTPRGDAGGGCRHASLAVDGRRPKDVLACPAGRGEWRFRDS